MSGCPPRTRREFITHFQSKLRRGRRKWNGTHCLEWTGARTGRGYGNLYHHGRYVAAHRVAWEIVYGPPGDTQVLHHCDNRLCVNLLHLFGGTQRDNIHDMWRKGRQSAPPRHFGEANAKAKLTARQVVAIRRARARGAQIKTLATKYNVAYQLVSRIARGEIWPHISGPITKRVQGVRA